MAENKKSNGSPNVVGPPVKHPEGHTDRKTFTIPRGIIESLTGYCGERGVSASEVVTQALRSYLKRIQRSEK